MYMISHIKPTRLNGLPDSLRLELVSERNKRGWSQAELGRRVGLPQAHISGIETGKITPRFDTLLDLVRVLDHDLLTIPRALAPAVQALVRDYRRSGGGNASDEGELPLYGGHEEDGRDES